jgi:hypothetical protein
MSAAAITAGVGRHAPTSWFANTRVTTSQPTPADVRVVEDKPPISVARVRQGLLTGLGRGNDWPAQGDSAAEHTSADLGEHV